MPPPTTVPLRVVYGKILRGRTTGQGLHIANELFLFSRSSLIGSCTLYSQNM